MRIGRILEIQIEKSGEIRFFIFLYIEKFTPVSYRSKTNLKINSYKLSQ
jgi:hypothetical protein